MAMIFDGKDNEDDFEQVDEEQANAGTGPDFARGERTLPADTGRESSDFAQGERDAASYGDRAGSDFAQGERTQPADLSHDNSDFARGERHDAGAFDRTGSDFTTDEGGRAGYTAGQDRDFAQGERYQGGAFDRGDAGFTDSATDDVTGAPVEDAAPDYTIAETYEVIEVDETPGMTAPAAGQGSTDFDRTRQGFDRTAEPDFARGERHEPDYADRQGPDFARGERREPDDVDKQGPDFARGQRIDPSLDDVDGTDFARGQRDYGEDVPGVNELDDAGETTTDRRSRDE